MSPRELAETFADTVKLNRLIVGLPDPRPKNWPAGDIVDFHHYPDPKIPPAIPGMARVSGEFGGVAAIVPDHLWGGRAGRGQTQVDITALKARYATFVDNLVALEAAGLSASVFTQAYDVEWEQNGLMTYDRALVKIPVAEIARLNARLNPGSRTVSLPGLQNADVRPERERLSEYSRAFRAGRRDEEFLRQLVTLAVRQRDHTTAKVGGKALLAAWSLPLTIDQWTYVNEVATYPDDPMFELLEQHAAEADAALGPNASASKRRTIIGREVISPILSGVASPHWAAVERNVAARYGELGREKVIGEAMLHYAEHGAWGRFADAFKRYYATAAARSEYDIGNLAYRIIRHVSDKPTLELAEKLLGSHVKMRHASLIEPNAYDFDAYAGLLYKLGRERDANEWQERAVRQSEGRDQEILDNMRKIRSRGVGSLRAKQRLHPRRPLAQRSMPVQSYLERSKHCPDAVLSGCTAVSGGKMRLQWAGEH
jgi:hypothetical protein